MKIKMKFYRAFASLVTFAVVAMAAQARPLDAIKKSGKIVLATEGQYAPFNFFNGSTLTGFEVELGTAVAKKMGLKPEWKALSFDALLTGLSQDRWDLVIASHAITSERQKVVNFTEPHYCTGGAIITKNPNIKSATDLMGKTVSVQTGTTHYDYVKASMSGLKDAKNFPQDGDARAAVQTGRVDAWIADRVTAKFALKANPGSGLHILDDVLFVERIAAATSKENIELAAEWNKALESLMADGTYATLAKKWLGEDMRCK